MADTCGSDAPCLEAMFIITFAALNRRVRQMLRGFPAVRRWDETDDVYQTVALQLWQSFQQEQPTSMRHFYAFASVRIRWCLLSLARRYAGPHGLGANHETWDDADLQHQQVAAITAHHDGPVSLAQWTEFHQQAASLPDTTGEVFHMIWYLGLPAATVARTLDISEISVRRHWRRSRLSLASSFDGVPF